MASPLTKSEHAFLDHVKVYLKVLSHVPTYEAMARHFGYDSASSVKQHVEALEAKGYLLRMGASWRVTNICPCCGRPYEEEAS